MKRNAQIEWEPPPLKMKPALFEKKKKIGKKTGKKTNHFAASQDLCLVLNKYFFSAAVAENIGNIHLDATFDCIRKGNSHGNLVT